MNIKKNTLKIIMYLFIALSTLSCINKSKQTQGFDEKRQGELKIETKLLKQLNDSLNQTGNEKYLTKYLKLIDSMIKKYPEQQGLVQVKNQMLEIFGDNLNKK
jgi:hypothetical protein